MITKSVDLTLESWFAGDEDHRLLLNKEDAYVRATHVKYNHGWVLKNEKKFKIFDFEALYYSKITPEVRRILVDKRDVTYDWVETFTDILNKPPINLPNHEYGYTLENMIYIECECCSVMMNMFNNSTGYTICDRCESEIGKVEFEL